MDNIITYCGCRVAKSEKCPGDVYQILFADSELTHLNCAFSLEIPDYTTPQMFADSLHIFADLIKSHYKIDIK